MDSNTSSTLEVSMDPTHFRDGVTTDEIAGFCCSLLSEQESSYETSIFLALYDELAELNHTLLSYVEDVAANIQTPAEVPLPLEISLQARSIRHRLSMMERLTADLKQDAGRMSQHAPQASAASAGSKAGD